MLKNYHILKVSYVLPTNDKPSRGKITSERYKMSRLINYNHAFNSICDIAEDYLNKNGFILTGHGEGKDHYYVITETFKPFPKH